MRKLLTTQPMELNDPFGLFDSVEYVNSPEQVKDGVLILWGGEDIGTSLYKEKPNRTVFQEHASTRDKLEMSLIAAAVENNVPIIGICRGAQILCVAAGGKLAQHMDGHGYTHDVVLHDEDDVVVKANSSHHQMMLPLDNAIILATADGTTGLDQYNCAVKYNRVNEVVYFPVVNGLGIQPHPEWVNCPQEFIDYCSRKIKQYLFKE